MLGTWIVSGDFQLPVLWGKEVGLEMYFNPVANDLISVTYIMRSQ